MSRQASVSEMPRALRQKSSSSLTGLLVLPWLVSWFGKLPGDIHIEKEGAGFYFPVVSMIIVSVLLTILMNFIFRR